MLLHLSFFHKFSFFQRALGPSVVSYFSFAEYPQEDFDTETAWKLMTHYACGRNAQLNL